MKGIAKIIEATIGLILVITVLLYLVPVRYEERVKPEFNFTIACGPACLQKVLNGVVAKKFVIGIEPFYYKRICFLNNKSNPVDYSIAYFNVPSWVNDCNTTDLSFVKGYKIVFRNNFSSGDIIAKVSLPFDDIVAFDEKGELRVGKIGSDFLIEIPNFEKNDTKYVYVFEGKSRYSQFPDYVDIEYEVQPTIAKRVNATIYVNLSAGESKCFVVECSLGKYQHHVTNYKRILYSTTDSIIIGEAPHSVNGKKCNYQEMNLLDGINWILYKIKVCEI